MTSTAPDADEIQAQLEQAFALVLDLDDGQILELVGFAAAELFSRAGLDAMAIYEAHGRALNVLTETFVRVVMTDVPVA